MPEARDPLARLRAAAAAREAAGLGRALRHRPPGPDPLTDLASNDYLGLAGADFTAALRALEAVRDHVRTASPVGRK